MHAGVTPLCHPKQTSVIDHGTPPCWARHGLRCIGTHSQQPLPTWSAGTRWTHLLSLSWSMCHSLFSVSVFTVTLEASGILHLQLSLITTIVVIVNICIIYGLNTCMDSLNSHSNLTVPASYKNSICHLLDTYCVSGTAFDALIPTYSHLRVN